MIFRARGWPRDWQGPTIVDHLTDIILPPKEGSKKREDRRGELRAALQEYADEIERAAYERATNTGEWAPDY